MHKGISVEYKVQRPRQDRRHLVVVFSGFCPIGTYNFDGSVAQGCRFGILWINDVFGGNNCYYLTHKMNFGIASAVISLIDSELERLGLSKDECTLFGYSKGGSAALYFALKYGFKNVVTSAPQMHIGTFSKENFPDSYFHMVGTGVDEDGNRKILDALLPDLLVQDADRERNIYLVSSLQDQFHQTELVPYLPEFNKYVNFNLIMTDSELVREHKTVGRYNTPILLSILYALGEGSVPSFVVGKTGQRAHYVAINNRAPRAVVENGWQITCDHLTLRGSRLFVQGAALLKGLPQTSYQDKQTTLVLESRETRREVRLGSVMDTSLSDRFYEDGFCDYRAAGYKTLNGDGITLHDLPSGKYTLSLKVGIKDVVSERPLITNAARTYIHFEGEHYYHLRSDSSSANLVKRSILGTRDTHGVQRIERVAMDDDGLHVEGVFAIPGVDYGEYNNHLFSLVLEGSGVVHRMPLGQGNRKELTDVVDGGFGDYSKSYFATKGYKGYWFSGIPVGTYRMYVSTFIDQTVLSMEIPGKVLHVEGSQRGRIEVET